MKKTRWDVLSVKDKASLIKLFVNNGVVSLKDMIDMYNTHTFSEGGDKDGLELSGGVLPGATITSKKVEKRNTPDKDTFIPSNFIVPIEQPIERKARLVNNYLVDQYNTIQEDIRDYLNNTTFLGDPVRTPNESLQYLKDLQDEQQYLEDLSAIKNINRYSRGGKINKKSFSTTLNKKREAEFQDWYSKVAKILNLDSNPDNQEHGYDYRGYWLENRKKDIDYSSPEFHFPDTWKQPWHETFSNESQYANMRYGINPKNVGHWEGETFIPGVYNDIMGGRSPQSEFLKTKEWAEELIGPPKPSMVYTPSNSIIEYIKNTEGFSPVWYKDGNGVDTIGYGFTGEEVKKLFPNGITKEQADKYFSDSLAKRVKVLQRDTPNWDILNQNQRDSLLSYHYNIGEGSYRNKSPKMQKALREKDWKTVTENIDFGYNDSANRGLRKRRDYERALFNTPVETKTSTQYNCGGRLKRKNRIYVE